MRTILISLIASYYIAGAIVITLQEIDWVRHGRP